MIARFLAAMTTANRSPCTLHTYGKHLAHLDAWRTCERSDVELLALRRDDLRSFVMCEIQRGLSPPSVAVVIAAMRSFYRWAARMELIDGTPAVDLRPPKRSQRLPRWLDHGQMVDLLEPMAANPLWIRDRAILEVLYSSGIRCAELVSLTDTAIDLDQGIAHVRGKGGKERLAILGAPAVLAVREYLVWRDRRRPGLTGALFLGRTGKPIGAGAVRHLVALAAQRRGLSRTTPHALRHTMATHMLDGGANIRHVQEMLGHASVATTGRYTHCTVGRLRAIMEKAHPRWAEQPA